MNWIKVEENLPDKPEVCQIAAALGLDVDTVTGKLIRIWAWASRNCHASGVTAGAVEPLLDRLVNASGFVDALVDCGWCKRRNGRLIFANFDRHNSQTAKERALAAERASRSRHASSVTKSEPDKIRLELRKDIATPPIAPRKREAVDPPGFAEFWQHYPRKVGKGAARKAWARLHPPLPEVIAALGWQARQEQWTREGGRFIPHPATWLNGSRWQDEPSAEILEAQKRAGEQERRARRRKLEWDIVRLKAHMEALDDGSRDWYALKEAALDAMEQEEEGGA